MRKDKKTLSRSLGVVLISILFISQTASLKVFADEYSLNRASDDAILLLTKELAGLEIKEADKTFDVSEQIADIDSVNYKKVLTINGAEEYLYPEFDNPEKSLQRAKKKYQELLSELQKRYDLPPLSDENYQLYYEAATESIDTDIDDKLSDQIIGITEFFDIYENGAQNQEIEAQIEEINTLLDKTEDNKLTDDQQRALLNAAESVNEELPCYTEADTTSIEIAIPKELITSNYRFEPAKAAKSFNVSAATKYAVAHASDNKINPKYGRFKKGDCANFTSQIKRAGGVKDYYGYTGTVNPTMDKNKSWYFNNKNDYGAIWSLARKFARHFNINKKFKRTQLGINTMLNFTKGLKQGSFIAYDTNGDGDVDHVAYITKGSTTKRSMTCEYNNAQKKIYYYDVTVAQHSKCYCGKMSGAGKGWITYFAGASKIVLLHD